jgi:N-acetylmuramoyl-L-alanine amidase
MQKIHHVYKSLNFDERNSQIDMLVIHATKMDELPSIERLCDPLSQVSCHYLINQNGEIYCLVDEEKRAWHAGPSFWRGRESLNHNSIGIELVNPDHNLATNTFPKAQIDSLIELCSYLIKKYNIADYNIVGHSDIAPNRKDDPGQYFDWRYLAENHVGIFPKVETSNNEIITSQGDKGAEVLKIQKMLKDFGYKIELNSEFDEAMAEVVIAFKRRFYQQDLSPSLNFSAFEILKNLIKK